MKYIYVCSPYGGQAENYQKALYYGRYVASHGYAPIVPHTMLHGIYKDEIPEDRKSALKIGEKLLKMCDEIWVFGKLRSEGMKNEIFLGDTIGKPIRYITESFSINSQSERLSVILHEYEELTCNTVNRAILEDVLEYINAGLSDELIKEAMRAAARKHAGWNYSRAILQRCLRAGITTKEDFQKRSAGQQAKSKGAAYDLDLFEKMLNEKD